MRKKKKQTVNNLQDIREPILKTTEQEKSQIIQNGCENIKDVLAPKNIDRTDPSKMIINSKNTRSFLVSEFPSSVYVGWLDSLYNYDGDIDISSYIFPVNNEDAIESLTAQITQFESQLQIEERKGEIRNVTRYRDMITGLIEKRRNIERGTEKIFQVQILGAISTSNEDELEKEFQRLESNLRGQQIGLNRLYFQQDEGFKSLLPYGLTIIPKFRNFSSGALTACFPWYNSEIIHSNGIICGRNMITGSAVNIDFYDRKLLPSSNIVTLGQTGSGKTYLNSILIIRSMLQGIHQVIIDPEGEFDKICKCLGKVIDVSTNSSSFPNMFDIDAEEIINENTGLGTGLFTVNLKEKISDLLNSIESMLGGEVTPAQKGILSEILALTYSKIGITEDPNSLFTNDTFDESSSTLYLSGKKKRMPTFSDFYSNTIQYINENKEICAITDISSCAKALKMYTKGQVYDLFDKETPPELEKLEDSLLISFNISKLENDSLRPLAMQNILNWTWTKFIKKKIEVPKRVIVEEAWLLVSKTFRGYQYTATALENFARRIRKRLGGLLASSQNVSEFNESSQGRAILRQATVTILLKQVDSDANILKEIFNLSDGEIQFLLTAKRGEALFKVNGDTIVTQIEATPLEHRLIDPKEPNPFYKMNEEG